MLHGIQSDSFVNKFYMTTFQAFKLFFVRACDFKGRTSRKEFWLGILPNAIIMVILLALLVCGLTMFETALNPFGIFMIVAFGLFCVIELLPSISLIFRRMHDIGKSGAYIFTLFVPIMGFVWYIYLVTRPSDYFVKSKLN